MAQARPLRVAALDRARRAPGPRRGTPPPPTRRRHRGTATERPAGAVCPRRTPATDVPPRSDRSVRGPALESPARLPAGSGQPRGGDHAEAVPPPTATAGDAASGPIHLGGRRRRRGSSATPVQSPRRRRHDRPPARCNGHGGRAAGLNPLARGASQRRQTHDDPRRTEAALARPTDVKASAQARRAPRGRDLRAWSRSRPATRRAGVTHATAAPRRPTPCNTRTGPEGCTRPWATGDPGVPAGLRGARRRRRGPRRRLRRHEETASAPTGQAPGRVS